MTRRFAVRFRNISGTMLAATAPRHPATARGQPDGAPAPSYLACRTCLNRYLNKRPRKGRTTRGTPAAPPPMTRLRKPAGMAGEGPACVLR